MPYGIEKTSMYSAIAEDYCSNLKDPHIEIVWVGYGVCKSLAGLGWTNFLISGVLSTVCLCAAVRYWSMCCLPHWTHCHNCFIGCWNRFLGCAERAT